ncbi:MAG: hypothetical protein ACRDPT_17380, partial [Streptomycetales bacterium]
SYVTGKHAPTLETWQRIADGLQMPPNARQLLRVAQHAAVNDDTLSGVRPPTSRTAQEQSRDHIHEYDLKLPTGPLTAREMLTVPAPHQDDLELLRRGLNDVLSGGTVTAVSLEDWEQVVWHHGRATRTRPASVLLEELTADLAELRLVLERPLPSSTLRRLTRLAALTAGLMCLTLIKLGDRVAFRKWARTDRIAAEEAGDPITCSWVRAHEAYGYYYAGDFVMAVTVARHAQVLTGTTPSVGAVLASAIEARAHAVLGHDREPRDALERTETILGNLNVDSVIPSAFGYDEAQLRFHEGNAFTHLRDISSAWRAQELALELCPPGDYMDRALIYLGQASCLAHDGDASTAMSRAVEALSGLTSQQRDGIITVRARETIEALPVKDRSRPAVRELRDLLLLPAGEEEG